jgi:hypothetical protein
VLEAYAHFQGPARLGRSPRGLDQTVELIYGPRRDFPNPFASLQVDCDKLVGSADNNLIPDSQRMCPWKSGDALRHIGLLHLL